MAKTTVVIRFDLNELQCRAIAFASGQDCVANANECREWIESVIAHSLRRAEQNYLRNQRRAGSNDV